MLWNYVEHNRTDFICNGELLKGLIAYCCIWKTDTNGIRLRPRIKEGNYCYIGVSG
jgi:hypothetical protein